MGISEKRSCAIVRLLELNLITTLVKVHPTVLWPRLSLDGAEFLRVWE